jgi:hypothetical protein
MEGLIFFAIYIYFWFHLIGRSDIAKVPREWLKKTLGPTLSYPLDCAFCASFWVTLATWILATPTFLNPFVALTFVPVFNMVLDLIVQRLKDDSEDSLEIEQESTSDIQNSLDMLLRIESENAALYRATRAVESGWKS